MNCYCLLNHQLTSNQISELKNNYDVSNIIYPDQILKTMWSQIPAQKDYDQNIIDKITTWLKPAKNNDILIVQGEFGTTFQIVDYALKQHLIPVHAVTERVAKEEINGESVKREYIFKHVCFRKYKYFYDDNNTLSTNK